MATATDFTAMFKDVMGSFPVNTAVMDDAFKNTAALNEKLSAVALEAAEKSAVVSNKWALDTVAKLSDVSKIKAEPADYAKAFSDFASSSAEVAAENISTFTEIAKKLQLETVELLVNAGKEAAEEVQAVAQKATADVQAATKKATAEVQTAAKKAAAK